MDLTRITSDGTASEVETDFILIARDNLVCAICDARLEHVVWVTVSNRKRKGVLIFACCTCSEKAKTLLEKLL